MDINFEIKNQKLKRSDQQNIVNYSNDYLVFNFDFSNDWNGLTKFLLVFCDDKAYRFNIEQDKFTVPYQLITGSKLLFSVYGVNEETIRITTNKIKVFLNDSGFGTPIHDVGEENLTLDVVEAIYVELDKKAYSTDVDAALSLIDSITINKKSIADDGYFATYTLNVGGVDVGERINIPKDYLLKDADIKVCMEDNVPVEGYHVGDYYFDFVVNTEDSADPKHLYLLANVLKDVYRGDGSTIVISNGTVSVKSNVFADKVHTHDDRYYTESEVDALIVEAIHDLDNRIAITSNPPIIQSGEVADISVQVVQDGVPISNKDVYFFEKLEPSLNLTSNVDIIQTDEVADISAMLKDVDGSLVQDTDVYFFIEEEENVVEQDNNESLENEINDINEEMEDELNDSDL